MLEFRSQNQLMWANYFHSQKFRPDDMIMNLTVGNCKQQWIGINEILMKREDIILEDTLDAVKTNVKLMIFRILCSSTKINRLTLFWIRIVCISFCGDQDCWKLLKSILCHVIEIVWNSRFWPKIFQNHRCVWFIDEWQKIICFKT